MLGRSFRVTAIVAAMLFSLSCREQTLPSSSANDSKLRSVTIAQYGHVFIYLPLYVAQQKGFFKQQGLDVKFVDTGGDDKTFAALLGGSALFGVADPVFAAVSAERGQEGRVIGQVVGRVSFWGIAEKKSIPEIKSPQDLRGLSVATYPAPSTNYALLREYISRAPSDLQDSVQIREAAYGTLLALLKSGQADIIVELEPTTSLAASEGGRVVFSYAQEYGEFAFTGLTTLPATIAKDPDLVRRVVAALEAALGEIHAKPSIAHEVAKKEFPELSDSVISASIERLLREKVIPEHAEVPAGAWSSAVKLRRSIGDLKADPPARIVDNSFAQAVRSSASKN